MSEEATKPNIKSSTLFTRDNLEVLRGLDDEIFDLIYLDPPFNSNRDYNVIYEDTENKRVQERAFKDTWTMDDVTAAEIGELASRSPKLHGIIRAVGDTNGDSHEAYLTKMAVRLIELRRVLKPTGSIYLHCDPTMSHSLKLVMDAIFGVGNFRNEVIWSYGRWTAKAKRFQQQHDVILFYTKSNDFVFNTIYVEHAALSMSEYRFLEKPDGSVEKISGSHSYRQLLNMNGRVFRTLRRRDTKGTDKDRMYLDQIEGVRVSDVFADIPYLSGSSRERTGYPTQKPLALLRRLIEASSKEGAWVLDPFCGCATTCVAATELKRKWVGIDIAPIAVDFVRKRLKKEIPLETQDVIERDDVPKRKGVIIRTQKEALKEGLFGIQRGMCMLCLRQFDFEDMQMDHEVPRAQGGQDDDRNMQLLCGNCNLRVKGARSMAKARVQVRESGTYKAENEPRLAIARRRLQKFRDELDKKKEKN